MARIETSDLSTQAAVACLDAGPNASQIPGVGKLNGCLSLDPSGGGKSESEWKEGGRDKGNALKAEQNLSVHLSSSKSNK